MVSPVAALILRRGLDKAVLYLPKLSAIKLRRWAGAAFSENRISINWTDRTAELLSRPLLDSDALKGVTWHVIDTSLD